MQVLGLLDADAVLSTDTTSDRLDVLHHEGVDDSGHFLVELGAVVARNSDVQVHVAVTNVAMTIRENNIFLFLSQLTRVFELLTSGFNNSVVIV